MGGMWKVIYRCAPWRIECWCHWSDWFWCQEGRPFETFTAVGSGSVSAWWAGIESLDLSIDPLVVLNGTSHYLIAYWAVNNGIFKGSVDWAKRGWNEWRVLSLKVQEAKPLYFVSPRERPWQRLTACFIGRAQWRHGRSRDETKYRSEGHKLVGIL